jgi:hypothetical protein
VAVRCGWSRKRGASVLGRLVERVGGRATASYDLQPDVTTLGRGADNTIMLVNERVSRRHLRVRRDGDRYVLEDAGSHNGTYVNGERVTTPLSLRHGDLLTVGGTTLVFELCDETVDWSPEAPPAPALRLDPVAGRVWVNGKEVQLAAKEYLALALLYAKRGALVAKQELAVQVWPEYAGAVGDYNIEKLITRLRHKIEADAAHPWYLITVRRLGYRLDNV